MDRFKNPKPRHHGRDHLPGGEDPIPNFPTGGAPSVATFYTSTAHGDTEITVPANDITQIVFQHASLPSDGSITGPVIGGTRAQINQPMIGMEWLYCGWEPGAYARAGVLGTNSRIITADKVGFANAGTDDLGSISQDTHQWTYDFMPNAYIADELVAAYLVNGDSSARIVEDVWLVIYAWPAPSYAGAIPGYPG